MKKHQITLPIEDYNDLVKKEQDLIDIIKDSKKFVMHSTGETFTVVNPDEMTEVFEKEREFTRGLLAGESLEVNRIIKSTMKGNKNLHNKIENLEREYRRAVRRNKDIARDLHYSKFVTNDALIDNDRVYKEYGRIKKLLISSWIMIASYCVGTLIYHLW